MHLLSSSHSHRRSYSSIADSPRSETRSRRLLPALDAALAFTSPFLARTLLHATVDRTTALEGIALVMITVATFGAAGEYARSPRARDGGLHRAGRIILLTGFCEWSATLAATRFTSFELWAMYGSWFLLAAGCLALRAALGRIDRPGVERALIVGSGRIANRVAALTQRHPNRRIQLLGFVDDDPDPREPHPGPHLGGIDQLASVVALQGVDLIVVAFSQRRDASLLQALRTCDQSGVDVVVVPRLFEVLPPYARTYDLGGLALFDASARAPGAVAAMVKRALDVAGATLALVLLAPLLGLITLAIVVDDGGPFIFRQRRIGRAGRAFTILKFRTLAHVSDELDGVPIAEFSMHESVELVKRAGAARPTRIGALLRRTSADELPQLWNVLRGDMSLVGPRPLRAFEVDALDDWQRVRHAMRPGMTGLWQVMGRSDVRWDERLQLDCAYVRNWSLASDLGILARTLPTVIFRRGAV